jgi:hypothetical protein
VAQTFGYATGGFIAGRLRIRTHVPGHETHFRDGAHGFMSWVIGVGLTLILVFIIGAYSARTAANVASTIGSGALQGATMMARTQSPGTLSPDTMGYFVDALFRTAPGSQPPQARPAPAAAAPAPQPAAPSADQARQAQAAAEQSAHSPAGETPAFMSLYGGVQGIGGQSDIPRAEVSRILFSGMNEGGLSEGDRTYLARVIAARTGIPPEDADRRVGEIQDRALQTMRETAEAARKAGAYLSFWSFMALLFGAVASILGGIWGGEHRDQT